jgi:hypothetical protein
MIGDGGEADGDLAQADTLERARVLASGSRTVGEDLASPISSATSTTS